MKPNFNGLKTIYLHAGEVCYSGKPIVVSTVLGSCLSIIMVDKNKKYSGISHCQLPTNRESEIEGCLSPYKYVDCTIKFMINKFAENKISKNDIDVKIFGGADVLKNPVTQKKEKTVGAQNIKKAIEELEKHNLKIVKSDVGGEQGRKIFFLTNTGEVFLNRLKNNG